MKTGKDLKIEWDAFLQSGSEGSFYCLYTHYHHYLTYIGLKQGGIAEHIKDCINDLFLYLYENRERLMQVRNHHNYILSSFLRKLFKKEKFTLTDNFEAEPLLATLNAPSVETTYILQHAEKQAARILKHFINKLPPNQNRIIYQRFYLGMSYEEIAYTNHIAIKTAYNTAHIAVDKLRGMLGKDRLKLVSAIISSLGILFLLFFKFHWEK